MIEKRTTESILSKLKKLVESKTPVSPEEWIDAALFLEVLKLDEYELLTSLEMTANQKKLELRQGEKSAIDADLKWRASKEWENFQRQKRKVDTIQEFVRIAKKQADIRKI